MLAWWEKLIVHAALFFIVFLVGYGSCKQAMAIHAYCLSFTETVSSI